MWRLSLLETVLARQYDTFPHHATRAKAIRHLCSPEEQSPDPDPRKGQARYPGPPSASAPSSRNANALALFFANFSA